MTCTSCKKYPVADCGGPCKKGCGCNSCCGKPILDIDEMPDSVSILRFNMNGLSTWYDFGNLVYQTQTDTTLRVNAQKRFLAYGAERHDDIITHNELGSILHLADIGDVDISKLDEGSLLVYRKDADCGQGCEGINNAWTSWNSEDQLVDELRTIMGFDDDGRPRALNTPETTNETWLLTWNGAKEAGWSQPTEAVKPPTITEGEKTYAYRLYLDPSSKQIVYVKEEISPSDEENK